MSKSKLFENYTFSRKLPEPFLNPGVEKVRKDFVSRYNTTNPKTATLHESTLKAALNYITINASGNYHALGTQGDFIVSETTDTSGTIYVVVFNKKTRKFLASCFQSPESSPESYILKDKESSGTALIFTLMPLILQDTEALDAFSYLNQAVTHTSHPLDNEILSRYGAVFCDNIYRRIELSDKLGDNGILVNIPNTGNIQGITPLQLKKGTYAPDVVIDGTFKILKPGETKAKPIEKLSIKGLKNKFRLSERTFTNEEQQLIPELSPWYIIPNEVIRICQHALATTPSAQPMRNFLLRGTAGTGKTEGARAISAGLGLPYTSITCSANTEIFDLLGQVIPEFGDNTNAVSYDLPTLQDIQMDPSSAFCKMTGTYNEEVTETDVYEKLIEVIKDKTLEESDKPIQTGQKFRYVETPLVKAIKYGYICEIQEPSVIANPGVLVGLNSLLDNCKQITLPTGETINRHPDTVIVVTTNNNYNGCRDMNQSILSRMNLILDMEEPDKKVLVERVSAITGFEDSDLLNLMASTIGTIQHRCHETMITDGCCGVRELIAWVQSYQVTDDISESAKYTVISAVSADAENREEIFNTCIKPIFD